MIRLHQYDQTVEKIVRKRKSGFSLRSGRRSRARAPLEEGSGVAHIIQVKPPLWVEAQVERHSRSRVKITIKARSQFKEEEISITTTLPYSTATNVEIELPVPSDATNPNIRTSMGSASYAPENDALVWKVKSFPGGKEYMCRAEFSLPSITAEEATPEKKAPIRVKFEIPYFSCLVRYLKIIEKSGYQALPWVRYITMAGEYELRLI
ncbi:hypothetical protein ZIOFF_067454 [Zingiber officinale]|uniref:MHD domain-containing protein n=1 Tax=Zingiber officinale TaxID=94328 RepID=A0A8J5ER34_ZINOF|nr:hypothetical protein ZIOFF_067454 [Zingiber officinale]